MARSRSLNGYQRTPAAIIDPANPTYLADELQRIEEAFAEALTMIPQPAAAAPRVPRHGMQRLAMSPWRPIGGEVDRWVWWDEDAQTWHPLNG